MVFRKHNHQKAQYSYQGDVPEADLTKKLVLLKEQHQSLINEYSSAKEKYDQYYKNVIAPQKERLVRSVNALDLYTLSGAYLIKKKVDELEKDYQEYIDAIPQKNKEYLEYYCNSYRRLFFQGQELIDLFGEYWDDGTSEEAFIIGDSYYTEYKETSSFDQNNPCPYPYECADSIWKDTIFYLSPEDLLNAINLPSCADEVEDICFDSDSECESVLRRMRVEDYDVLSLLSDKKTNMNLNPEKIFPLSTENKDHFKYKRFFTHQNLFVLKKNAFPHNIRNFRSLCKLRRGYTEAPELMLNTLGYCESVYQDNSKTFATLKDPTSEITIAVPSKKEAEAMLSHICAFTVSFKKGEEMETAKFIHILPFNLHERIKEKNGSPQNAIRIVCL